MNIWVFIYRASWVAIVVLTIVLVVALFAPKFREMRALQDREEQLREEVRLEQEMLRYLQQKQERLRTDPRFVEKIAREELGLAKPGETIFKFIDEPAPTNARTRRP
ncbi:MAG: septum formation initiator family protein [Kiritimatiellae bacterium]|nr:septum formation initiator family protein [Kiritimatiellia bacterium]MDW8459075.1 septum formation initiator family protein [Verrucomicrobiota bacterium]